MVAEFTVGTKVVHPHHGAGTVTCIEEKGLGSRRRTYYVIETIMPATTLMIPIGRVEVCGLRAASSANALLKALCRCAEQDVLVVHDFRKRREAVGCKICSGEFGLVAEAVHHLRCLREERRLSETDRQMLEKGTDLLVSELAVASGMELPMAQAQVNAILDGEAA